MLSTSRVLTIGTVRVGGVSGSPDGRALTPRAVAAVLSGFVSEDIWQMGITLFRMAAKPGVLTDWDTTFNQEVARSGGAMTEQKVRARAPGARVAHRSV